MDINNIHAAPVVLETIGPIQISNAMVSTWLVFGILIVLGLFIRFRGKLVPGRLQMVVEMSVVLFLDTLTMSLGSEKKARRVLPLIATIFLFLLLANQLTLIPLIQSFELGEHELFTKPTSHYSLTIALALLCLGFSNIVGFMISPLDEIGRFLRFQAFFKMKSIKELPNAFIDFFLGIMEIIEEMGKIISTSTRLFGNIFAGEVVVVIVSGLMFYTQFIIPIPFLLLETLFGFIQAFVFAMLMTLFISSTLVHVSHETAVPDKPHPAH